MMMSMVYMFFVVLQQNSCLKMIRYGNIDYNINDNKCCEACSRVANEMPYCEGTTFL